MLIVVCIRTYYHSWVSNYKTTVNIIETCLNLVIVIDYLRNVINAPVKKHFIFSMFNFCLLVIIDLVFLIFLRAFLSSSPFSFLNSTLSFTSLLSKISLIAYIKVFFTLLRTFLFFLVLRNTKLWKFLITKLRDREIVITVLELLVFIVSFGCLYSNCERGEVEYDFIDALYAFVSDFMQLLRHCHHHNSWLWRYHTSFKSRSYCDHVLHGHSVVLAAEQSTFCTAKSRIDQSIVSNALHSKGPFHEENSQSSEKRRTCCDYRVL